MRRLANIIVITIGVVATLFAPMIPHHHHGEVVCTIIERCYIGNVVNDEHKDHHRQEHGEGCTSCDKSAQWVDTRNIEQRQQDIKALPQLILLGYELHVESAEGNSARINTRPPSSYVTESHGRTDGLRAPPMFIIPKIENMEC